MKENLLTLLIDLLKKNLTEIDNHSALKDIPTKKNLLRPRETLEDTTTTQEQDDAFVKQETLPQTHTFYEASQRFLVLEERCKLTNASYQFLIRFTQWNLISTEMFELIVQQLLSSESRLVSLQETKWAIRKHLENTLNAQQLAFLDLILYHSEDKVTRH